MTGSALWGLADKVTHFWPPRKKKFGFSAGEEGEEEEGRGKKRPEYHRGSAKARLAHAHWSPYATLPAGGGGRTATCPRRSHWRSLGVRRRPVSLVAGLGVAVCGASLAGGRRGFCLAEVGAHGLRRGVTFLYPLSRSFKSLGSVAIGTVLSYRLAKHLPFGYTSAVFRAVALACRTRGPGPVGVPGVAAAQPGGRSWCRGPYRAQSTAWAPKTSAPPMPTTSSYSAWRRSWKTTWRWGGGPFFHLLADLCSARKINWGRWVAEKGGKWLLLIFTVHAWLLFYSRPQSAHQKILSAPSLKYIHDLTTCHHLFPLLPWLKPQSLVGCCGRLLTRLSAVGFPTQPAWAFHNKTTMSLLVFKTSILI